MDGEATKSLRCTKMKISNGTNPYVSDFKKPFTLYTDASGTGIGAVLSQLGDDGREYVIMYAS